MDRQTRIGERITIIIIVEAKNERRQSEKEERTSTYRRVVGSEGSPRSVWKIRPVVHFNI